MDFWIYLATITTILNAIIAIMNSNQKTLKFQAITGWITVLIWIIIFQNVR